MRRSFFYLVIIAAIALVSGCNSSSDSDDDSSKAMLIKGVATAEEPLEAATVSVYTLEGTLVDEFPQETQGQGTFLVSVPWQEVENGYRVEVSGGVLAQSRIPFTETIVAVVDHWVRHEDQLLHVGFASTLLAAYMDRHPEKEAAAAESEVAEFLGIPETQHLLTDLFFHQGHFSREMFASHSSQNGGLAFFVETLLDEIDAREQGRTFAPAPGVGSAENEMMKIFAKALIKGAGSEIGSRGAGWILDSVFDLGEPAYPTDPAILNGLKELGQELKELRAELEEFQAEMHKQLIQILSQTEKTEYTALVISLLDDIELVERLQSTLWFICNHESDPYQSSWEDITKSFRDELDVNHLEEILRKFRKIQEGGIDTDSAIDIWGTLQTRHAVYQQNHESLFTQFQMYANLQLNTLNLLLEKLHLSGGIHPPEYYVDLYTSGIEKQGDIFLQKVMGMMALTFNKSAPAHPYQNSDWHAYDFYNFFLLASDTREAATLRIADAIVGHAKGLDQGVIIRLAQYYGPSPETQSILANVPVVLINIDTGLEYAPDQVYRNRVHLPEVGDVNLDSHLYPSWDVNRYVFTTLPEGTYTIKNVNDQFPNPYGASEYKLFHPEYLKQQIKMEPGEFHNMLVGTYAAPGIVTPK